MEKEIKFLGSAEMAKICKRLVVKRNGIFESPKQMNFFFWQISELGIDVEYNGSDFWKEVEQYIGEKDRAIITQVIRNSKGNFLYEIYILDNHGVRALFTLSRYWKNMKSSFTFRKENWKDTAERRREQSVGEYRDQELVYGSLKKIFIRDNECFQENNTSQA